MSCYHRISRISRGRRGFATVSGSSSPTNPHTLGPFQVFDRNVKRIQKDRAATKDGGVRSRTVDYVRNEVAYRMIERFLDVKRDFDTVVDLGSGSGHLSKLLRPDKVKKVIMVDSSECLLQRDPDSDFRGVRISGRFDRSIDVDEVEVERIHADEERFLDIVGPNSHAAVMSCLSLHWVNDLPGILVQIKEALQPDGLFLAALFGGDTLFELRTSLQLAEVEREGGISPRVSPMTDTRDVANLLGRAGFTLLTVDIDEVKVNYPSMFELMGDLRDMGESNAVIGRRSFINRDTLAAASAIYKELHGEKDGSVPATFQIIHMIGWKPSPTQRKPLERGTAETSLKDVL